MTSEEYAEQILSCEDPDQVVKLWLRFQQVVHIDQIHAPQQCAAARLIPDLGVPHRTSKKSLKRRSIKFISYPVRTIYYRVRISFNKLI